MKKITHQGRDFWVGINKKIGPLLFDPEVHCGGNGSLCRLSIMENRDFIWELAQDNILDPTRMQMKEITPLIKKYCSLNKKKNRGEDYFLNKRLNLESLKLINIKKDFPWDKLFVIVDTWEKSSGVNIKYKRNEYEARTLIRAESAQSALEDARVNLKDFTWAIAMIEMIIKLEIPKVAKLLGRVVSRLISFPTWINVLEDEYRVFSIPKKLVDCEKYRFQMIG